MISQRNSGGTAAPLGYQYQLASDAMARRILSLGPYDSGAGTLHFRAAPRGPRQQGTELISQPLQYVVKGQAWWFSIWISISLHTVPLDPRPRLHLHTGVTPLGHPGRSQNRPAKPAVYAGHLRLPQPYGPLAPLHPGSAQVYELTAQLQKLLAVPLRRPGR
jgi:hypothetical protein